MKDINCIICLVLSLLIVQCSALDQIESHLRGNSNDELPGRRKLVLFQELRCQKKMKECQVDVGDSELPLAKWSSTLSQFGDAQNGIFDLIQKLIEIASQIQFVNIVEQMANALGLDQVNEVIATVRLMFQYIATIRTAIENGDLSTVLNTITEMVSVLNSKFRLDVFGQLDSMIQIIVDTMNMIVSSLGGNVEGMFDNMIAIVRNIADYFSDFVNVLNGIFMSRCSGDTNCEENLLQCSKDRFMLGTVPQLILMGFLSMADNN